MQVKTKISLIFVVLSFIISGIYLLLFNRHSLQYEIVTAKTSDITQDVLVTGTVDTAETIDLKFNSAGKIASINVAVNDIVPKGKVLAMLDTKELNTQLSEAKAGLAVAKAKLDKLLAGSTQYEINVAETSVARAKASLKSAKQHLIDVQEQIKVNNLSLQSKSDIVVSNAYIACENAVTKKIDKLFVDDFSDSPKLSFLVSDDQAKININDSRRLANSTLQKLKSETDLDNGQHYTEIIKNFLLDLNSVLNKSGNLSPDVLDSYYHYANEALSEVSHAFDNIIEQQQAIRSTKASNQMSLNTAKAQVESAKQELLYSEAQLALKKAGASSEDIDLRKAEISQAEAGVLLVMQKINNSKLVAPISGIITHINYDVGELATTNQTAISMISTGKLQINADIPEADIANVQINNPVSITFDAFNNIGITPGRIVEIEPKERIIDGVVYYRAIISFADSNKKIKPGMTVNLVIVTKNKKSVITIPQRAIIEKNGNKFVRIIHKNKIKQVPVKTGIIGSSGEVEIISGLKNRDKVIILAQKND